MSTSFVSIAALMVITALVCVLLPMLRSARRNGRPRAIFVLALALVFALPPAAIGLYAWYGAPRTLASTPDAQMDMATATAQLRAKLLQAPDNLEGWLLLGQAYAAMNRPTDARDAFGHALHIKPGDPDIMVAWAEADAQMTSDHRIAGEARTLLQRAVALQPDHQRGLWLLGISDYQLGHYDGAASHWRHLSKLLPAGSTLASAVDGQIAMATARAQGKTQAQAEAIAQSGAASSTTDPLPAGSSAGNNESRASDSVALKVEVRLDPELAGKVSPDDTLFVFARAVDGPQMPLAVARLRASQLPATVTLTDAMAMAPQLKLSMFPEVEVTARISRFGDAMPKPGDPESQPVQARTDDRQAITLTIDHAH